MSIQNQALAAMHFPGKLHDMMTFVEKEGLEAIISWVKDGTAIMIHNPTKLVQILVIFFSQTKYRSFRRQLSGWHFERIQEGPSKGAFMHPYFQRGEIELCDLMSRHRLPPKVPLAHSLSDEKNQNRTEESKAIASKMMPNPADFSSHKSSSCQITEEILAAVESVMQDTEPSAFREGFDGSRMQHLDFSSHDIQQISSSCQAAGEMITAAEAAMGDIEPSEFREGLDGSRMQHHEHINDGDMVSFAGRSFHFLDFVTTLNESSQSLGFNCADRISALTDYR